MKLAMNHRHKRLSACLIALASLLSTAPWAQAQTVPALGTASSFAVLSAAPSAAGVVTCVNSTVNGDVGSSGTTASVIQIGCPITGTVVAPVSSQVVSDFNSAYSQYSSIPCTGTLDPVYTSTTLTLTPGVYCSAAAVTFTNTTLTLDGQGNANAVWIFKIGTGGTGALTGTNFSVVMAGSGQPCNVDWWVADAVTLTTTTTSSGFQGNVLAGAPITLTGFVGSPTPFNGDALSKAAVTLTNVTVTGCAATSKITSHGKSSLSNPWGYVGTSPKLSLPSL